MSYHMVICSRNFEAFDMPLDDKEGEDPVRNDYYEETFLNMCSTKRENRVWWLRCGANRRRDDMEEELNEEENEEEHEEEDGSEESDAGESTPVGFEWEETIAIRGNEEARLRPMVTVTKRSSMMLKRVRQPAVEGFGVYVATSCDGRNKEKQLTRLLSTTLTS
ncbi:hypothetical protein Dimus_036011 [Dionaea muscipula]